MHPAPAEAVRNTKNAVGHNSILNLKLLIRDKSNFQNHSLKKAPNYLSISGF